VAPAFDYCVRVSVFEIDKDGDIERTELYLGTLSPIERVGALIKEGVTTLVCGAMSEALDKLFHSSGISVMGGIGGPVEEVLEAFMSNRLDEPRYCMPGIGGEKHPPPVKKREARAHPSTVEGPMEVAYGHLSARAQGHLTRKSKVHILLVESDLAGQQAAVDIFQESGCKVDAVRNGREAIKALELACYDLVFMDVRVLDMDGHEATKAIRDPQSTVRCHDVPVIAMTEHSKEKDRERYVEAGMDHYIAKPLEVQRLREIITRLTPPAHPDSKTD
jgi:CheY-like chemotaxis protein/predicted Fe-Mo cluster-binding NifX family protein